jgi:hypothetical protein
MARNRKGPPEQAKHFKHDDPEHAAHRQEAARGRSGKPSSDAGTGKNLRKPSHPGNTTPRGPSRGQ